MFRDLIFQTSRRPHHLCPSTVLPLLSLILRCGEGCMEWDTWTSRPTSRHRKHYIKYYYHFIHLRRDSRHLVMSFNSLYYTSNTPRGRISVNQSLCPLLDPERLPQTSPPSEHLPRWLDTQIWLRVINPSVNSTSCGATTDVFSPLNEPHLLGV